MTLSILNHLGRTTLAMALLTGLAMADQLSWDPASGDGHDIAHAIFITEVTEMTGVQAEYDWVAQMRPGWEVQEQALIQNGDKVYDVLTLKKGSKTEKVYFDITGYFGKL